MHANILHGARPHPNPNPSPSQREIHALVDEARVVEDATADQVEARPRQAQDPVARVAENVAVHQAVVAVACSHQIPFLSHRQHHIHPCDQF